MRGAAANPAQQLPAIVLLALFCAMLAPVMPRLWALWSNFDETYGYVLLLLPLVLAAIVRSPRPPDATPGPLRALFALAGAAAGLLWACAALMGLELRGLLLPPVFWCAWGATFGVRAARACLGPALMLYFLFPVWDPLGDTLVALTASATGFMVREWTGITAYIYGNHIALPSGSLVIANGCSGLRYLVVGLILCSLGSRQNRLGTGWTIALLAVGACVSLAANWVRVLAITLVAYYSEMQSPLIHDHEAFGWVLFFAMYAPVFLLLRRLPEARERGAILGGRSAATGIVPAGLLAGAVALLPGLLLPRVLVPGPVAAAPVTPLALGSAWSSLPGAGTGAGLSQYLGEGGRMLDIWQQPYGWQAPGEEALRASTLFAQSQLARSEDAAPGVAPLRRIAAYSHGDPALALQWYRVGPFATTKRPVARALQILLPLGLAPAVEEFWAVAPCAGQDCRLAAELLRGLPVPARIIEWQPPAPVHGETAP